MSWVAIFEMILKLLENCSAEDAQRELKNPGMLTRLRVRRAARIAAGDSWRGNQREIMDRIWADHAAMTDEDRDELLRTAGHES